MNESIVFMFSGQGSQYYSMGKELFEENSVFREWILKQDNIIKKTAGFSVIDELFGTRNNLRHVFDRMKYTHPAIFMVEYALAQVLMEKGVYPDYVLGTSMGEFASAAVAGIMSLEDILGALVKQAEIVEASCPDGCMIAILDNPDIYYSVPVLNQNSEMASVNYNRHFVISVGAKEFDIVIGYLNDNSISFQKLPVRYPYHSSGIDCAKEQYLNFLEGKVYRIPQLKFISCLTGRLEKSVSAGYFWDVVRNPIQFSKSVQFLEENGDHVYIDLGPSGTLANFAKNNLRDGSSSRCFSIITQFKTDCRNLEVVLEYLNKNNLIKGRMESEMLAYVFPGQGSQQKGMGGGLFDEFKEITEAADRILGYSIKELCIEDPEQLLGNTKYTQPALYTVSVLNYLKRIRDTGVKPDFVAGHSLGEYVALFAAGVFDFETGLKIVKKRAELMSTATGGGMAAVLGLGEEQVKRILEENNLLDIDIANFNAPSQIVISGKKDDIERARSVFEGSGAKRYIVLNVSGAFHSRYMKEAAESFRGFIDSISFNQMSIPVISNKYARPYKYSEIKNTMVEQITSSVKWTETVRYLMGKGVENIEQIGPGTVLTGLTATIKREAEPLYVNDEEEYEKDNDMPEGISSGAEISAEKEDMEMDEAGLLAAKLGDSGFKKDYGLKFAYLAGSMYKGIASKELVVKMGKSGMLGFLGTGGMELEKIEQDIKFIQRSLSNGEPYGLNLLCNTTDPDKEEKTVDLYIRNNVRIIEASSYMSITPALVRYRLNGIVAEGRNIKTYGKIIAKVSRPEVAESFLSPAPQRIIDKLLDAGSITEEQAELSRMIPMADDLCVEADSGGHTDGGVAYTLVPTMLRLRDEIKKKYGYKKDIRVGTAGGIGTPEAAAAAFLMGADFIMTGSINHCTVEAGTSDDAKDMLQQMNVQDTEYAPAGDMFELGAKVQVLRKGLFFPARANKLYDLYRQYDSIDEIDEATKAQIQQRYFNRTFDEVYEDVKAFHPSSEIEKAEKNPKHKMALIFRWYFGYSTQLALSGDSKRRVDYQIHCGPALGAFNQWVKGTELENWRNRHVDVIARKLMTSTAELFKRRLEDVFGE